jgi:hypothetical protein
LLRRLSLDLTGLPPSPERVRAFLEATRRDSEAAWAEAVDELLASPHFGEHWARHWLDLARYADSDGYLGDAERPWAWVYRDWVIDAIRDDLPFDRFSMEQLAGDLLPGATVEQRVATGFHRHVLRNTEAGADRELDRTKQVVDRVATTGTVWLGLTLGCAECHDHKHDPVPQRDFYRLYAYFNNVEDVDLPLPGTDPVRRAPVLRERAEGRRPTRIHVRGDYARPGEEVSPGVPEALHPLPAGAPPDRLGLARWLFDEANPLTARVAVNQIWQALFGVGLVATPDDFGVHGTPPTHPELLDWLALSFRRSGWSRKALIRTIVTSATYRQSSANTRPDLSNELLWRQESIRVGAETVRDLHLAVSGLLSPKIGGPGVYPPLPGFVTEVGRSVKWPESQGADRYRRGLYIFRKRTVLYPMLTVFDAPDTSASCARRERTDSPMQALTLLNDPVFFECAEALARDVSARHGADPEPAAAELFRRCLQREPDLGERETLLAAHRSFLASGADPELALVALARVVMNLDEFVTRD